MDDPDEDCEKVVKKDKCDSKGDKCMESCGLCEFLISIYINI